MNVKILYQWIPSVRAPEKALSTYQRLYWTLGVLILFFIMGLIRVAGVAETATGFLEQLQVILASNIGTLITAGIGPIVLASIILQMLVGTKIIRLDLGNSEDRKTFTGLQRFLAIVLAFFEALLYSAPGRFLSPVEGYRWLVVLQVAMGSIVLMYMDDLISKYGYGSGIGLFIAGGVAQAILWRAFSPLQQAGVFIGIVPQFFANIFAGNPNFVVILPLISTVVVFFIVVFFESIHVNIPVAVGRAGMGGRFPIKLLYASNIPVIFAAAFFANLQFLVLALQKTAIGKFLGIFSGNNIVGGVACYVRAPYGVLVGHGAGNICNLSIFDPILAAIIHVLVFSILFIGACILFGALWVEIGGQGPENIAEQFASSKMFIPGFRSDPRVIKGILYKYIPTITVLGSLIVGLLAVFADLAGVIGSGTGILLTVGIIYRLYEDLAKQQLLSNIGLLRRFM